MSTAGLASAVGAAEGRTETRRAGSARAREPDTLLVLAAVSVQRGREAKKPQMGPLAQGRRE